MSVEQGSTIPDNLEAVVTIILPRWPYVSFRSEP